MALMAEARWRTHRHLTAIARLDAYERLSFFLLDIHDRLRRHNLIARPTFHFPLTQDQIADHLGMTMVHVNRISATVARGEAGDRGATGCYHHRC
jgi:CRP-like cAMP-binding protein